MEGSFSHDNHRPKNIVPQRNQFAPNKRGFVDFRDSAQRRRYVNEQVARHVPLEDQLRIMREWDAFNKEREEEAVHAKERRRYRQQLLEEGDKTDSIYTDGYQKKHEEETLRLHEEARHSGRIEAAVERQNGTPLRLRDAPDRRKYSAGEYRDQTGKSSPTYGNVTSHVDRLRLGQFRALERLDEELRELARRREQGRSQYVEQPRWTRREGRVRDGMREEINRLQESLDELRASLQKTVTYHAYGVIDAAQRLQHDPPRSHAAKPIKPRGDGRSIRTWDDV